MVLGECRNQAVMGSVIRRFKHARGPALQAEEVAEDSLVKVVVVEVVNTSLRP